MSNKKLTPAEEGEIAAIMMDDEEKAIREKHAAKAEAEIKWRRQELAFQKKITGAGVRATAFKAAQAMAELANMGFTVVDYCTLGGSKVVEVELEQNDAPYNKAWLK